MPKNNINKKPTTFRGPIATGLAKGAEILDDGGEYGAGIIPGFAVITRGEALGHGMWVDEFFVGQVAEALSKGSVKSRYTHPGMSSDGLAKSLGRVHFSDSEDKNIVRGDLHFFKSSRKAPDGDLGGHVISLAKESPESFGSSIVFNRDLKSETAHALKNGAEIKTDDRGFKYLDMSEFKSTDPLNKNNFRHARLESLGGCDIVGDPAANPDGLFSRDSVFEEIESFAEYVFGQSEDIPQSKSLDIDPDRAKSFLSRYLNSKGLAIMSTDEETTTESETSETQETETTTTEETSTEDTSETSETKTEETTTEETSETKTEGSELSAGQKEAARFKEAFGKGGADYFADGLTFEQATTKHIASLNAKIETQAKDIKSLSDASPVPIELGDSTDKTGGKKERGGLVKTIEKLNARPVE